MNSRTAEHSYPAWAPHVLRAAAVYNLAWGLAVVLFPQTIFTVSGLAAPRYPGIWQCLGMVIGVFGIGYWIAARNPVRHWPIVFVGLLGKIFGPIGFVWLAIRGDLPWTWGWMILANDVVWWIPIVSILYYAARYHSDVASPDALTWDEAMKEVRSQRGATLAELSRAQRVLVVFLRHSGCTFCRETLGDVSALRWQLQSQGVKLALVHMDQPMKATQLLSRYALEDAHHFSDSQCGLYVAFGLQRGKLRQVLGLGGWHRAIAAIAGGHGFGPIHGDAFRMPGVFVLENARLVNHYRHVNVYDRPNYLELVQCSGEMKPIAICQEAINGEHA